MIARVLITLMLTAGLCFGQHGEQPAGASEAQESHAVAEHAGGDHAAAEEHGGEHEESLSAVIMHHIVNDEVDHPIAQNWGLTKASAMMLIASVLLILLFGFAMRPSRLQGPPKGWTNALEAVVLFIRDEVAISAMGKKWGKRFTPFLCTLFFFILACNLLGMIPGSYTATSNLNVTATLSMITLAMIIISGIVEQGPMGYLKHMVPAGTPLLIAPMVFVIELLSLFVKPVALTIRLGANMTAGHIVILVMLSFIFVFQNVAVAGLSIPLAVAITILETIVAFIQAYVFTLLSSIFIGMVVHSSH
ncbi:MAG: F0F1 ATP synthase subunit A [Bryobacterales bacterium]